MAITGTLGDFSLPELLQFLDHGKKTGLLQVRLLAEQTENKTPQIYYIWLHQGRVIAAADRLDRKCLTLMITQRGWVSERVISRVTQISSNSINTPLGLFLKSQGMLQSEQLKLLFNTQILRPICTLFQIQNGHFTFNPMETLPLPLEEMTGLSMAGTEVILMGLRALRDWKALADKLPATTSALSSPNAKKPQMQLNAQEWQVWEFVNGNVSLENIAHHLRISVEKVQQIAYRLIIVGLIEEHIINPVTSAYHLEDSMSGVLAEPILEPLPKANVSQSFLKNLVGFLRSK